MKRVIRGFIILFIIVSVVGFYFYVGSLNDIDKTSEYYENNLYLSDQRVYNNYLDDNQKDLYDLLINLYRSRDRKYETTYKDLNCEDNQAKCIDDFHIAFDALLVDHPEMLELASYEGRYYQSEKKVEVTLYYAIPFKAIEYVGETYIGVVLEKIKEETKDMTDAEKIVYVYNWIGERSTYDYDYMLSSKDQSAYSAIVMRHAVCAGFAKTAAIIFQYIGINAYSITGHEHMWNVVEYNDKYYYFDSTVSACVSKDKPSYYKGITQTSMNDYGVDHGDWYPVIEQENFPFLEEVLKENEEK